MAENKKRLIQGLAHTAYNVADMEASLKYYREALGFEKAFDLADHKGNPWIVYLYAGDGQFIELFYGKPEDPKKVGRIGADHLCLLTEDIRAAAENIKTTGHPLDSDVKFGSDGNWQCWTHDPDGNRIEIMQMGEGSLQNAFIRKTEG